MGKVASSSIYETVRACGFEAIHVHTLNDWDLSHEANVLIPSESDSSLPLNIQTSLTFRHGFDRNLYRFPIPVITLVRDPVARNISAYFENLDRHFKSDDTSLETLIRNFLDNYPHEIATLWLDREIRELTRLDLLDHRAAANSSDTVYENARFRILVMRVEDSDEAKRQALEQFLDVPVPEIVKSNEGQNKAYADLYREFMSSLTLPQSYLDAMYESDFSKRFWNSEELQNMRARWKTSDQLAYSPPQINRSGKPRTGTDFFGAEIWQSLLASKTIRRENIPSLLARLAPLHDDPACLGDVEATWRQDRERRQNQWSLDVSFTLNKTIDLARIGLPVFSDTGILVTAFGFDTMRDETLEPGRHHMSLVVHDLSLTNGCYFPILSVRDGDAFLYRKPLQPLRISGASRRESWGLVRMGYEWVHEGKERTDVRPKVARD
jgi:hypothetical protein